jgi:tetratricopeptide (TPR) repeat protein
MTDLEFKVIAAFEAFDAGDFVLARSRAETILLVDAKQADALYLLGRVAASIGQIFEAQDWFERAIVSLPGFSDPYTHLIRLLRISGKIHDAERVFDLAHSNLRTDAGLTLALADALSHSNPRKALESIRGLLIEPYPAALVTACTLASALNEFGDEHNDWVRRLEEIAPTFEGTFFCRAQFEYRKGNIAAALTILERAVALHPEIPGLLHIQATYCGNHLGHEAGIQLFDKLLARFPEAFESRFNRCELSMKRGRISESWPDYQLRDKVTASTTPDWTYLRVARWGGESLTGKHIVVFDEQGFGDCIMFARFLARLSERARKVTYACYDELYPLFASHKSFDAIEVTRLLGSDESFKSCDFYAKLMDLPRFLGISDVDLASNADYLANTERPKLPTTKEGWMPRIGLCWEANLTTTFGKNKSIPLELISPQLMKHKFEWISLQKGFFSDLSDSSLNIRARRLDSFSDTADVIQNLDLVISVDTSVAHLSASMGKPTWILSQKLRDWRWYQPARGVPLWYPAVKVIDQTNQGDWSSVLDQLDELLSSEYWKLDWQGEILRDGPI